MVTLAEFRRVTKDLDGELQILIGGGEVGRVLAVRLAGIEGQPAAIAVEADPGGRAYLSDASFVLFRDEAP